MDVQKPRGGLSPTAIRIPWLATRLQEPMGFAFRIRAVGLNRETLIREMIYLLILVLVAVVSAITM